MIQNIAKQFPRAIFRPLNNKIKTNTYCLYKVQRSFWNPFSKKQAENTEEDPTANMTYEQKNHHDTAEEIESFKSLENLEDLITKAKQEAIAANPILLPPKFTQDEGKLTVCVELDDIFLFAYQPDEYEGYMFRPTKREDYFVDLPEYDTDIHLYKRDHCDEFFDYIANECEGVIYSTGSKVYVDKVMDVIDPDRTIFKHRLYQESCGLIEYDEENLKELVKFIDEDILGRDEKRTVLLDTKYLCFWPNPDNAMPVKEFVGSKKEDNELQSVINLLEDLKDVSDVREVLKEKYFIRKTLEECNLL